MTPPGEHAESLRTPNRGLAGFAHRGDETKMKVMHVIAGLNRGGAEGALARLVRNDTQNTHCVVSLMDRGVHGEAIERAGSKVYALGMPRGRVTSKGLVSLFQLMRSVKPDVVQTWMYHADLLGGLIARAAGVETVVWGIRHSNLDPDQNSLSTRLVARACATLSGWVPTAIASCSEEAARVHQTLGYSAEKFSVIANGFECQALTPDPAGRARLRAELGIGEDHTVIGLMARWDPQKDHANLLRALTIEPMKSLGHVRCLLIGPGVDETNKDLVALVTEHGLRDRVSLLGPRSDVRAVMSALDVHVLSSAFGEAFPNVVAESMACGTPSVVTDVGDAALIVGETGWVVPPSNSPALSQAIYEAVLESGIESAWVKRQQSSRSRIVERFSVDRMSRAYTDLWRGTTPQSA